VKLKRAWRTELIVIDPLDDSLEIIKGVFKKQKYKVSFYDNNPTRLKAIRVFTRGKKRKGRLHFSAIIEEDGYIHIYGHKDRCINGQFVADHKNSQAKREMNRLQGILVKALEIKPSKLIIVKKENLIEGSYEIT